MMFDKNKENNQIKNVKLNLTKDEKCGEEMIDKITQTLTNKIKKEMPEIFSDVTYNEKFEEMYFQKLADISYMKD